MNPCLDTGTKIYFIYDVSGSISEPDLASLRSAVAQVISGLQQEGIPPGNLIERDSDYFGSGNAQERYLQWFLQPDADYVVVAFMNEADPEYHGQSADTGPTPAWLADHDALVTHLLAVSRFRAFIYALEPATGPSPIAQEQITTFNTQHMPRALGGTHGYPSGATSITSLGVTARVNVPSGQDANTYFQDILSYLETGCSTFPVLDAPVTVRFAESLNGVFADPTIDASFFQMVDLPIGGEYELGDQLSGDPWYRFLIRDRSRSGGLVSYTGETLLARLARARPRESLVIVAGQGGIPDPLDLRECLERFLDYYGIPFDPNLPAFFLRSGDQVITPTVDAFVIQPNQESPESLFEWLERFFGPFRGYTWRSDEQDRLVVRPPAWLEVLGLRLHVYKAAGNHHELSSTASWAYPSRAPTATYSITVAGSTYSGSVGPLNEGVAAQVMHAGLAFDVTWAADGESLTVALTTPSSVGEAPPFDAVFTARPESDLAALAVTSDDLGPDEIETSSADSVINQAVVQVRRRTFQADQPLMQPAAVLLRSPQQLAAGSFGSNIAYGPMAWAPTTPGGFLELANAIAQAGAWFWPADPNVVIQPGGDITVTYDVEEWAEQWRPNSSTSTPHAAAANVNAYTDSMTLPANGTEVKLFDFQFPRQTTNFAPSPYGAQGSVYGRWRGGTEPGIELRIANSRFAEFGYLPEVGPFGQTVYFLWGVQVKLNGTGTTWTVGDLETYRFGFSRATDGTWEDGASVPGLAQSQSLFPDRVYTAPELPYEVDADTALALARGIVEENLVPKTIYQLPIAPSRPDGYAAKPWHVGGAADVPALGVKGRVTAFDYRESHAPGATTSGLTVDVEVAQPAEGTPAATTGRRFGRAVYGVTTYQEES